jgi:uncharacterized protein (DUF3084 family)
MDDEEALAQRISGPRPAMLGGAYPTGERIRALEEGFQYHREQIHAANNRLHRLGTTIENFSGSVKDLENELERFERVQHELGRNVEALQAVNKSLSEKEAARQRRRDDVKSVAAIVTFVLGVLIGVSSLLGWLRDAAPGP